MDFNASALSLFLHLSPSSPLCLSVSLYLCLSASLRLSAGFNFRFWPKPFLHFNFNASSLFLDLYRLQCRLDGPGQSFIWTLMCLPPICWSAPVSFPFTVQCLTYSSFVGKICLLSFMTQTCYVLQETLVAQEWLGWLPLEAIPETNWERAT